MAASPGTFAALLRRIPRLDAFNTWIIAMVVLASVLPARGAFAEVLDVGTNIGIALLFFLHGAKLSREDILGGIGLWRLHSLILVRAFVLVLVGMLGLYVPDGAGDA